MHKLREWRAPCYLEKINFKNDRHQRMQRLKMPCMSPQPQRCSIADQMVKKPRECSDEKDS
jgi:hypothetical protein